MKKIIKIIWRHFLSNRKTTDCIYKANDVIDNNSSLNKLADLIVGSYVTAEGHVTLAALSKFNQLLLPHGVDELPHAICVPRHGTYSPWKVTGFYDEVLEEINPPYYLPDWEKRPTYTLVDIYRVYGLYQGILATQHLPGDCIEIGVYKGGTAAFIGNVLRNTDSNSHLFVADTFEGVVKANPKYDPVYKGGEHNDASISDVNKLLHKYCSENRYSILEGIFPESANHELINKTIKFCHIDVDVYFGSIESYHYLYPLMPKGGITIFDDFGTQGLEGVTKAVHKISKDFNVNVFHMFNGQAMVIKQ